MIAVRTLCARLENVVCTPWAYREQQLLARRRSVMDDIKTLWERRVDAVGTLWGRCVHVITGKVDIFRRISRF